MVYKDLIFYVSVYREREKIMPPEILKVTNARYGFNRDLGKGYIAVKQSV